MVTLRHVLHRTKQSPLDLTILFDEGDGLWAQGFIKDFIVPNAPRIRTLSLQTRSDLAARILSLEEGDFCSMEALEVYCSRFYGNNLFERTPVLRKLIFLGGKIKIFRRFAQSVSWFQLTHLDSSELILGPVDLHVVLVQCASLEECTLKIGNTGRTSSGPEYIAIPFLREFKVMITSHFPPGLYSEFLNPLVLPSLEKLSLEFCEELDGGRLLSSALIAFLNRSSCAIKHLRIQNSGQTDLEPVLEILPLLTHLSTGDAPLSASLLQRIRRDALLPHLQSLECRIDLNVGEDLVTMVCARWVAYACRAPSSVQGDLRSLCFHTLHIGVDFLDRLKGIARSLGLIDRDITLSFDG